MNVNEDRSNVINTNKFKLENNISPSTNLYNLFLVIVDVIVFLLKFILEILTAFINLFFKKKLKDISGETVLITGTGHGIGKELALQYAGLGCEVICIDINEKTNTETVKEINEDRGGTAYGYKCDITNHEDVQALANRVLIEIGNVSVIVNNAGIMPCHQFSKVNKETVKRVFDVNVFSHFWILEAFLPQLVEKGRGHIIAISSMAGLIGLSNLVPYCASKYAVRGLMEALNEELREDGRNLNIQFTTIFPYMVDTGLCKNPKTRFPSLLALVPPKMAAASIISAHRQNMKEACIPRFFYYLTNVIRVLPYNCGIVLKNFLDSGVEAES